MHIEKLTTEQKINHIKGKLYDLELDEALNSCDGKDVDHEYRNKAWQFYVEELYSLLQTKKYEDLPSLNYDSK